jgi:Spy/CpxP family protein refolding chaperone
MKSLFTRHGMLLVALSLSLLFNLFVLVGFVQSRAAGQQRGDEARPPGPPPQREPEEAVVRRVTRELKLTESQQKAFAELHAKQRAQALVFDASMAIVRQDMSDELGKDSPDPQRLRALIGQEADLMRERRVAGAELMGNFVTVLTPEQRKIFGRRVGLLPPPGPDEPRGPRGPEGHPGAGGHPPDGGPGMGPDGPEPRNAPGGAGRDKDPNRRRFNPGPEIMRRFDVNKNGRLDPDEMQAAKQELEARRREFRGGDRGPDQPGDRSGDRGPGNPPGPGNPGPGGPREVIEAFGMAVTIPLWRWFDQDNDGRLSDAEQQSMREFTESHPTPQRPPPRDREGAPPTPPQN